MTSCSPWSNHDTTSRASSMPRLSVETVWTGNRPATMSSIRWVTPVTGSKTRLPSARHLFLTTFTLVRLPTASVPSLSVSIRRTSSRTEA